MEQETLRRAFHFFGTLKRKIYRSAVGGGCQKRVGEEEAGITQYLKTLWISCSGSWRLLWQLTVAALLNILVIVCVQAIR